MKALRCICAIAIDCLCVWLYAYAFNQYQFIARMFEIGTWKAHIISSIPRSRSFTRLHTRSRALFKSYDVCCIHTKTVHARTHL